MDQRPLTAVGSGHHGPGEALLNSDDFSAEPHASGGPSVLVLDVKGPPLALKLHDCVVQAAVGGDLHKP